MEKAFSKVPTPCVVLRLEMEFFFLKMASKSLRLFREMARRISLLLHMVQQSVLNLLESESICWLPCTIVLMRGLFLPRLNLSGLGLRARVFFLRCWRCSGVRKGGMGWFGGVLRCFLGSE